MCHGAHLEVRGQPMGIGSLFAPCRTWNETQKNLCYPATLDALHQNFFKFGTFPKITIFTKDGQSQVLLHYTLHMGIQDVQLRLDSQNIYSDCCIPHNNSSKLTVLVDFCQLDNKPSHAWEEGILVERLPLLVVVEGHSSLWVIPLVGM
ncbi:polypyrimidine tract-binding protein 1-like isoform X2 [Mesocricetus auratus]|nr:polypyrimidine tract-binding protein 1-like isoform X2 [Mesocricetus auratus]